MATLFILFSIVFRATVICGDPSDIADLEPLPIREQLAEVYLSQVGVREAGKNNHGPEVKLYLASVGLGEGYAWCAAFTKWGFDQVGIATTGANAWSPSWFPSNRIIYKRDSKSLNANGKKGDVFGLYYANLKRIGHVGFIHEWTENYIVTVEGNTNDGGSREGDGVYKKKRLKRQIYAVADWINT